MVTHLYVRSGFSLMQSTIHLKKLVAHAKAHDLRALALTDEGVMYGTIPFIQACQSAGIKPIIGITVRVGEGAQTARLILLAKNETGYHTLIRLSTRLQTADMPLTAMELEQFSDGVLAILPASESELSYLLVRTGFEKLSVYVNQWGKYFAEGDFYLGIDPALAQQPNPLETLEAFAAFAKLSTVALAEARYLDATDKTAFHCLQAMEAGRFFDPTTIHQTPALHLRTTEEMEQLFAACPKALQATEDIADKCHLALAFGEQMLPSYPVEKGQTAHQLLTELCVQKIKHYYNTALEQASKRMYHELAIIEKMKFSDYFLIVWDFIAYAKQNGIMVGPGRGSAAGSLVAYILGITEVDPLEHHLLFERFLNPERVTMPDIDVDFSDQRRDEVIHYVRDKYGAEHVAQIITFGTFAARSLIRELVKTLEINTEDMRFILKEIGKLGSMSIVEYAKKSEALRSYISQSEQLRTLFKIAAKLEGLPRHISTHAAGVVISEAPLISHVPLTNGGGDVALTQYPMNDLETIGLLKMDFLGLRNLSMIERMLQSIRYTEKIELNLQTLPKDDALTFQLLQQGQTNGIFQLESAGMKRVLRELKPTRFDDIVAVNALYRPGPMEYIPTYIRRKHGDEKVTYPHPDLEPILRDTYGVLVYQEQIMQIANKIAGFSLGRADILRRAVSKKRAEAIEEQKEAFLDGCLRNGYTEQVAVEIFDWIVRFSNYGFNKSHAVAYSEIAYQLSYLKAHYPASFFAELMGSVAGHHDKLAAYIKEVRGLGLEVLAPSVNHSFGFFTAERGGIRMGLNTIKGIGHQVTKEIVRARKDGGQFKDLFAFCLRVDGKLVPRATIENLILAGAFDALYPNRATLLASLEGAMEQGELFGDLDGQASFFQEELQASYTEMEDFSQMKKLHDEKELLGVYISSHPLKKYRAALNASGFIPLQDASAYAGKRNQKTCAIVQSLKVIRTKRGDPMAFLTLADETEDMEAVMFPELYRNTNRFLEEDMMLIATGKIEQRKDALQWILNDVAPFDAAILKQAAPAGQLFIKLASGKEEREALTFLAELAKRKPGQVPIIFHHADKKQTYRLQAAYAIDGSPECLKQLKQYFGGEQVVFREDV